MSTFGSSGIDFTNHRLNGAATYFNEPDPALMPYGHFEPVNTGGDGGQTVYRFVPNPNSRITEQGYIRGVDGRNLAQLNPEGNYNLVDPNARVDDAEFGSLTSPDNIRQPHDMWDRWLPVLVAAGILGPAAYAASGAGAGAGAAGAGEGAISPGMLSNFAEPTVGAMNMGGLDSAIAGLGYEAGAGLGSIGGLSNFATPEVGSLNTAGLDSAMSGLTGGAPVTDLSTNARFGDQARNLVPGGGGTFNTIRGAAGLAATLAGMGGGAGRGAGGGGGNGGGGGGGDAQSLIEQMINANRYDQNGPFGSRHWAQGPDGRWTVTDSLNPAEQHNYESLQGMNQGVTDFATQRLAALMAQGARPRADRSFQWNGMTIGG